MSEKTTSASKPLLGFGAASGLVTLCAAAAIGAYDFRCFLPVLPRVRAFLAAADPEDRTPPAEFRRLMICSEKGRTAVGASKLIMWKFNAVPDVRKGLGWLVPSMLWVFLTQAHLSEDERIGVIATMSHFGNEQYGLTAASKATFGRAPSQLTQKELATLVAYTRLPAYFRKQPDSMERYRAKLLESCKP